MLLLLWLGFWIPFLFPSKSSDMLLLKLSLLFVWILSFIFCIWLFCIISISPFEPSEFLFCIISKSLLFLSFFILLFCLLYVFFLSIVTSLFFVSVDGYAITFSLLFSNLSSFGLAITVFVSTFSSCCGNASSKSVLSFIKLLLSSIGLDKLLISLLLISIFCCK